MSYLKQLKNHLPTQPWLKSLLLLISPLCLITFLDLFSPYFYLFDAINSFKVQYTLLFLLAIPPFLIVKKYLVALVLTLFMLLNLSSFVHLYFSQGENNLKNSAAVMTFNILSQNRNHSGVIKYLQNSPANIIILLEVTPEWQKLISAELTSKYPYQSAAPRSDNFGIMLLSQYQYVGEIIHLYDLPLIHAKINLAGKDLNLFAIHPPPPVSQELFQMRNDYMMNLATLVNNSQGDKIICGDFNMTPWAGTFKKFAKSTNTYTGKGIDPSWPSFFPPLKIPIDNCLISKKLTLNDKFVGENLNSDHLPLIFKFSW